MFLFYTYGGRESDITLVPLINKSINNRDQLKYEFLILWLDGRIKSISCKTLIKTQLGQN